MISSLETQISQEFLYKKIRVPHGGHHFDRGMLSREMFAWLHLINQVTVDCTGDPVVLGACSACLDFKLVVFSEFSDSKQECVEVVGSSKINVANYILFELSTVDTWFAAHNSL